MDVPHGCIGRIGAEYEFYGDRWKLHRVDLDQSKPYVFRRGPAYLLFTLRRFVKLTKYWDGDRHPWQSYRIPCFQCRVPIPGLDGSLFCDDCRPMIGDS